MTDGQPQLKLTTKQRLFVDFYLGESQYNATDAARRAGYKFPNVEGPTNLVNPSVRARLDEVLNEAGVTRELALALVLQDATRTDDEIFARAASAPGVPAAASTISAYVSARTTARSNLAKARGLLADRLKISGRVDHVVRVPQQLHNLSDDELAALERIALKAQDAEHEVPA